MELSLGFILVSADLPLAKVSTTGREIYEYPLFGKSIWDGV